MNLIYLERNSQKNYIFNYLYYIVLIIFDLLI